MNIVLLIDGTGNDEQVKDRSIQTNVCKLKNLCRQQPDQLVRYLHGVGTYHPPPPPADSPVKQFLARMKDRIVQGGRKLYREQFSAAFGIGTALRIRKGYRMLCRHYRDYRDTVYLFGFSRGAFAAVSLAGFANKVGLLFRDQISEEHLEDAFAIYAAGGDPNDSYLIEFLRFLIELSGRQWVERPAPLPIHFLGVWDTVGALGLPGDWAEVTRLFNDFHLIDVPRYVDHARHALAIHELRDKFEPSIWKQPCPQNSAQTVVQMWFPGAHADVGGGYSDDKLSNSALRWMIDEAAGLRTKPLRIGDFPPDYAQPLHHQIQGVFSLEKPRMRQAIALRRQILLPVTRQTFAFHESVRQRWLDAAARHYTFPLTPGVFDVNEVLGKLDDESLQLWLDLSLQGKTPNDAWWTAYTVDDLAGAPAKMEDYMQADGPSDPAASSTLARFFQLLMLEYDVAKRKPIWDRIESRNNDVIRRSSANSIAIQDLSNWSQRLQCLIAAIATSIPLLPKANSSIAGNIKAMMEEFSGECSEELKRRNC